LDPLQRFLLGVSERSRVDDDELDETDRPVEQASNVKRKRRSKDRSYKLTAAFRRANGGVRR
jgi:hypothetical protein